MQFANLARGNKTSGEEVAADQYGTVRRQRGEHFVFNTDILCRPDPLGVASDQHPHLIHSAAVIVLLRLNILALSGLNSGETVISERKLQLALFV